MASSHGAKLWCSTMVAAVDNCEVVRLNFVFHISLQRLITCALPRTCCTDLSAVSCRASLVHLPCHTIYRWSICCVMPYLAGPSAVSCHTSLVHLPFPAVPHSCTEYHTHCTDRLGPALPPLENAVEVVRKLVMKLLLVCPDPPALFAAGKTPLCAILPQWCISQNISRTAPRHRISDR